jgi:hypothetical protein
MSLTPERLMSPVDASHVHASGAPHWAADSSSIIFLSSIAAQDGLTGQAAYPRRRPECSA